MSDDEDKYANLTPEERERVLEFERMVAEWRENAFKQLPAHVRALGPLLRRTVKTGRLNALDRWCKKHGFDVKTRHLPLFRDFLITQRIDLKDLEPAARERLRTWTLARQDEEQMTHDYVAGIRNDEDMRCRDCRYFVTPPNDGDPNDPDASKSCVALGTKGTDRACYGFTRPPH